MPCTRQINGEFDQVQEALLQITNRLREHFFRDAFPSMNHPSNHAFPDQGPPFPSYMGRRELSPPGMYSGLGPSFHKFNAGMPPMHGGFHPHDDRSPFMHNIHRPGFPPHLSERLPPAAPWRPQVLFFNFFCNLFCYLFEISMSMYLGFPLYL